MRNLLLFIFLLCRTGFLTAVLQEEVPPKWVRPYECPLDPLPLKPSQVNFQFLLNDNQCHWPENSLYVHYAIKPLTFEGAAAVAKVQVEFVPSWQHVQIHQIRVFRDGKWGDRLERARHSLLQREAQLEQDLYSGACTHVWFLEDVRVGDIVEYAYTIGGSLPLFSSHLASRFSLQGPVIFEYFYRRLLAHSALDVDCKLFHTSAAPEVIDLSPEVREWSWALKETEAFVQEEHSPGWHFPLASVQFSQYKSWEEVIQKLLPLFTLDPMLQEELPPEMVTLVQYWMETCSIPDERALCALRFVQEDVRYLGFEEGIDGVKPSDPRQVFQRRFGDCKDKVFLLHALLKWMGIESTPVLVSTTEGKFLSESIPLPIVFDHIILRIDIEGREYWVDGTMTLQGGSSLDENFCPIYEWGLPLSSSETSLVRIDGNFEEKPTLIETSFVVASEETAQLKIARTFHGHKADAMRRFLNRVGMSNYSTDFCKTLQRNYGRATLASEPVLSDDRKKNILTLTLSYEVPTEKKGDKRVLKAFSMMLLNYLENDLNPERETPYSLNYPMWVKEHLHVETPYVEWEPETDEDQRGNESLFYSSMIRSGGSSFDAHLELRHLKDHVPPQAIREYWEIASEIEQGAFFYFYVASVGASSDQTLELEAPVIGPSARVGQQLSLATRAQAAAHLE